MEAGVFDGQFEVNRALVAAVPQLQVAARLWLRAGLSARPPRGDGRRRLELVARHFQPVFVQHAQIVEEDDAVVAGLVVVEVVAVGEAHGVPAGGEGQFPSERAGVLCGLAAHGLGAVGGVLVELVEGVEAAPLVAVVAGVAVVLEGPGHRVERLVADGAGRVLEGRIVGVRQGHGIGGVRCGLLDIDTQEVQVGPARPGAIAVRGGGRIALQERLGVQHSGVGMVGNQGAGIDDAHADARQVLAPMAQAVAVVADDGARLELVDIAGVVEGRVGAVHPRRLGVRHDVVGGEHRRVRQVVLHDMRDQLQRRPCRAVLHAPVPVVCRTLVGLLEAHEFVVVAHEVAVVVDDREAGELAVGQEPVVACPQQELVEALAGHQAAHGAPQRFRAAVVEGGVFGCRGDATGEDQRGAAQGAAGRFEPHAVEEAGG